MSRIGKKPIQIPQGVEILESQGMIKVKGPKGELEMNVLNGVLFEKNKDKIIFSVKEKSKTSSAFWGLSRALLQNIIIGVTQGFEKQLEIIGVGYKAKMEGDKILDLAMGFSHPIKMQIPEGLLVKVEKNIITISGIDKQKVGQFSAKVRDVRKPEPYKGKGIRYVGEKVRRKEGKKTAKAGA